MQEPQSQTQMGRVNSPGAETRRFHVVPESPPHPDVCGPGSPAALPILPSLDVKEAWILGSWKMDLRSL